jgi:asparagine synthase (glutamine-hydrolysing)
MGDEFIERLEGMFGLALWDRNRGRLLVARDALGIKPVYYHQAERYLAFSSEAKALLKVPGMSAQLDPAALGQYLSVGYVSAPNSMFAGIKKLEPGTMMVVESGHLQISQFWKISSEVDSSMTERDAIDSVRAEMERAISDQMVSDVPIGAFLSGGLDSSSVVAFMSRHTAHPVKTYSIGFSGSSGAGLYNELPYAREVAMAFGTDHREIIVQPDVVSLLPQLLWHMDEPVADAAFITTYLVSKFARQDVTVILSGVGGDELFGGYTRYLDDHYRRLYHRVPSFVRRWLIEPVAHMLPSDRHNAILNKLRLAKAFLLTDSLNFSDRYGKFMEVFSNDDRIKLLKKSPAQFEDCIARAFGASSSLDPLRRLMDVDLKTQLPEDLLMLTDKMSMAVSLECRVPLLDQRLTMLAAKMPGAIKIRNGVLKYPMKAAMRGVLPESILYRGKRGFGAPMGAWFKSELSLLMRNLLSSKNIMKRGLFDPVAVQRTLDEHASSKADRTDHLLALINLEIWCRLYLDGQEYSEVAESLRAGLKP